MLLYLTTDENNGVFDFLMTPEYGNLHVKKYVGTFDLLIYLVQNLRNVIGIYDFIAVDLESVRNKEDEILEALKQFMVMLDKSRLIVFTGSRKKGDRLLMDMVQAGVYNIVTGDTVEDVQSAIKVCTGMEGMSFTEASEKYSIAGEKKKEEGKYFIPQQVKNLVIAIAGTGHGAGATHTAFNILSFLSATHAKCAYCDGAKATTLQAVAEFFPDFVRRDHYFEKDGCHYYGYGDIVKESYDFLLIDLGVLSEDHKPYLEKAALSILCAKTKPWELPSLAEKKYLLLPGKTDLLYLFGSMANQRQLEMAAGEGLKGVHFANYAPDLWDGQTNAGVFRAMLGMNIGEAAMPVNKANKEKRSFFKKNKD